MAAKIEASEPIPPLEAKIMSGGGSPLGGAKPKALIEIDGETIGGSNDLERYLADAPAD